MNITAIISHLDKYLSQTGQQSIGPVEGNATLAKAGLLKDNDLRKGKPLREILRGGKIPTPIKLAAKVQSGQFLIQKKAKQLHQIT